MKKNVKNKVTMYKTVRDWVQSKKELTHLNHLPECLTILAEYVAQIDGLDSQSGQTTKGHTAVKSGIRKDLEKNIKIMVAKLQNAATFNHNVVLFHEVNFNESTISRWSAQKFQSMAEFIISKAKSNLDLVALYGITPEFIAEVEKSLADFRVADTSPRQIKLGTVNIHSRLAELIADTDEHLKTKMDVVVKLIKFDNPSLYSQYKSARKIVDR